MRNRCIIITLLMILSLLTHHSLASSDKNTQGELKKQSGEPKEGVDFEESSLNSDNKKDIGSGNLKENEEKSQLNLTETILKKINQKGLINPKLSLRLLKGQERGLFAKSQIQKGEALGRIHISDLIVQSQSIPTFNNQLFPIRNRLTHPDLTKMVLYLYEEMTKGEGSKWSNFFKLLPKDYSNIGFLIDFEKYEKFITGTSLYRVLYDTRYYMVQDYKAVKALGISKLANLTEKQFLEIFCLIKSRSFGVYIDNKLETILTPYLDLLNHGSDTVTDWTFDQKSSSFVLYTNTTQDAGQEVIINYGDDKSNFDLLKDYGFVLPNPKKISFTFVEGLFETDYLYEAKLEMFPGLKGVVYSYKADSSFSSTQFLQYTSFLRFKVLSTEKDYNTVQSMKEHLNNNPYAVYRLQPLSRKNELSMLHYLRRVCEANQGNYKTTLEQDRRALEEGGYADLTERNILKVRIEEREMLEKVIAFCQDMKALFESEFEASQDGVRLVLNQAGFEKYAKYFKVLQIEKFFLLKL